MKRLIFSVMLVGILVAGFGCAPVDPEIVARQTPPPLKSGWVQEVDKRLGLSIQHPDTFLYTPSNSGVVWLTIKSKEDSNAKVEIWNIAELADRPYTFTDTAGNQLSESQKDTFVPKHGSEFTFGDNHYKMYLYYPATKTALKNELQAVLETMRQAK